MPQPALAHVLATEHRTIDDDYATFVAALDEGRVDRDALTSASTGLRHHIFVEEEYFFPPLEDAGQVGPIFVMLREHGEMWDQMAALDALAAADEPDLDALKRAWAPLATSLEEHNFKEETILYQVADELLGDNDADIVRAALQNRPASQGWVCQMATPPEGAAPKLKNLPFGKAFGN